MKAKAIVAFFIYLFVALVCAFATYNNQMKPFVMHFILGIFAIIWLIVAVYDKMAKATENLRKIFKNEDLRYDFLQCRLMLFLFATTNEGPQKAFEAALSFLLTAYIFQGKAKKHATIPTPGEM